MNKCASGAYYTAKPTFSHDFAIKVWGAYYTSVRIICEFWRYVLFLCIILFVCCLCMSADRRKEWSTEIAHTSVDFICAMHYQHWTDYKISLFVWQSVSQWVCHTKQVKRSTSHNLPPIFTKLAITVVSQEMWSPIVFSGYPEYWSPSNGKWNWFLRLPLWENTFNVKYLENGERYACLTVIDKLFLL